MYMYFFFGLESYNNWVCATGVRELVLGNNFINCKIIIRSNYLVDF